MTTQELSARVDVAGWLRSHAATRTETPGPLAAAPARRRPVLIDVNSQLFRHGSEDPDRIRSALFTLSADCDYDTWMRLGFAVKDALGDAGLPIFIEWSLTAPHRYREGSAEQLFGSDKGQGVGVGTLYKLARDAGWNDRIADSGRSAAPLAALATPAVTAESAPEVDDAVPPLLRHRVKWSIHASCPRAHDFAVGSAAGGMFPAGKVSVLAGPGGVMKTALAVSLALHVAAGKAWAGHEVAAGGVLFLSLEDDAEECIRRASATALTQFSEDERADLENRAAFIALPGVDARLTARDYGGTKRTAMGQRIIEAARAHMEDCRVPLRLIVVDHARLAIGGDANDSEAVTELTRALSHIGVETGAAVLLLCHSPKSSLNPDRASDFSAADVLGSGAFVDNARLAAVMFGLTSDERKKFALDADEARKYTALRIIKSNYSEAGRTVYLRKTPVEGWSVAVPVPADLAAPPAAPLRRGSATLADRILALIAERPGQISKRRLREQFSGREGPLGASDRAIREATESLLAAGRLIVRPPTDAEAAELPRQTREVLDIPVGEAQRPARLG